MPRIHLTTDWPKLCALPWSLSTRFVYAKYSVNIDDAAQRLVLIEALDVSAEFEGNKPVIAD